MHQLAGLTKAQIMDLLTEKLCAQVDSSLAQSVTHYAHQFFSVSPPSDLQRKSLEDLYSTAFSYWQVIQSYDGAKPEVRVFNPDFEHYGWHSNHTVIQIHNVDMPFLVDSVRMELNRREVAIHNINNCVMAVERDKKHQLTNVTTPNARSDAARMESVICLEIDRDSDPALLDDLRDTLASVLEDVQYVVQDFRELQDQVQVVKEQLRETDANNPEIKEARKLLDWMVDEHFIFLGYEHVSYKHSGAKVTENADVKSRLGIRRLAADKKGSHVLTDCERDFASNADLVSFSKDTIRSTVHRPAYRDLVIVKQFDAKGNVTGAHRFYGLYTSSVFFAKPLSIPMVRRKVIQTLSECGFEPGGHSHKALVQHLIDMPREELMLASARELQDTAMGIFNLQERRKACLFVRQDSSKRFYSCLYYIPRDLYTTQLRRRIHKLLVDGFHALDSEVNAQVSESILSRTHFVLYVDPEQQKDVDIKTIEARILDMSRSWPDDLQSNLIEAFGEEQGSRYNSNFRSAFPSSYTENFSTGNAVSDIQHLDSLSDERQISMSFYRSFEESSGILKFKLYSANEPLVLSDVIPVLEDLGLRVMSEHPYQIKAADGNTYWVSDFLVSYGQEDAIELEQVKTILQDTFISVWEGRAASDKFNRLVIGGNLAWREVAMLRAMARYIKQLRFGYSQPFMAEVLHRNIDITRQLTELFHARLNPEKSGDESRVEAIETSVLEALEGVASLDDDKILRRFLVVIQAILRTNFFQMAEDGKPKSYYSYKIDSQSIPDIPLPKPAFEVYVYSPRMEGVHLRFGKVARGGLRWSDRTEDYRTEVLGLVKAQQVKNSVIVPVGAKGCFICKKMPVNGSREEIQAEGIECYKLYIRGLLDITDNLVGSDVVYPPHVVRRDEDDPYLVVAADKGTATFSDIANSISEEYNFWLGDAFASGGSQGYDHKGMGITARGAWESVKRHFREKDINTQKEEFSVIGIGDMAGDVFGNGMLLSETISLVAAFNHLHIFIDPNPEVAPAFAERQRMFELPRSSWTDYNAKLISEGGGIFERSAKWIKISPQMKARFDIQEDRLAPTDLLNRLLKAPVDMIWNGGIGTYVKATQESHADVGDKANDSLRVNGNELRCKVLGEGGNLGFTQLGRIEFGLNGGSSNTDFIDNAGGVDCSDHEVNIKILLNELVSQGDMTVKQRNQLLRDMTDDVSDLVLKNNYRQAQALNIAELHAAGTMDDYIRLIRRLEAEGKLDPQLEFLPSEDELQERKEKGLGFTRPELSVLISYAKIELKQALINSWITDDPSFSREMETAFPQRLLETFPEAVRNHRLRREITATQIANDLVNRMGITYVNNLRTATGLDYSDIAAAYMIVRELYDIDTMWGEVESLDYQVPCDTQVTMMRDMIQLLTRGSHWLLRNRRDGLRLEPCLESYKASIDEVVSSADKISNTVPDNRMSERYEDYKTAGVPERLAAFAAATESLYWLLDVIDVASELDESVEVVARTYFGLGTHLNLVGLDRKIREFRAANHWQALAKNSYRIELDTQQRGLTLSVLRSSESDQTVEERLTQWSESHQDLLTRWNNTLTDIENTKLVDCAIFSVALSVLLELA